jgi:glycosyltransferase involved in cell wall biosynthesis
MPEYCVVLMGKGDNSYINELKLKYPQILHISFIAPPEHLYVTSWAHIAIVKYDFVVLNAIFCAPNKTWEYTGFGIPVLCHDIPGLQYTVGQYEAGVCTDMDDTEAIKSAIRKIDADYERYSQNATLFYESFDLGKTLSAIVAKQL